MNTVISVGEVQSLGLNCSQLIVTERRSFHTHQVCGRGSSQNPASWRSAAWHLVSPAEEAHLCNIKNHLHSNYSEVKLHKYTRLTNKLTTTNNTWWVILNKPSSTDELSLHMCKSKRDMKVWYEDSFTSKRSKYWLKLLGVPAEAGGGSVHRLWRPGDGGAV